MRMVQPTGPRQVQQIGTGTPPASIDLARSTLRHNGPTSLGTDSVVDWSMVAVRWGRNSPHSERAVSQPQNTASVQLGAC
jgi:hypothetical protein